MHEFKDTLLMNVCMWYISLVFAHMSYKEFCLTKLTSKNYIANKDITLNISKNVLEISFLTNVVVLGLNFPNVSRMSGVLKYL